MTLPQIDLAFGYLQQFWAAAAALCCPAGNAIVAAPQALMSAGSSGEPSDAGSDAGSDVLPIPGGLGARSGLRLTSGSRSGSRSNGVASPLPHAREVHGREMLAGWRHPGQLVLPLLSYAARMALYLEASAPQREWMLYAARRLSDALCTAISADARPSVPRFLSPIWRGVLARDRDEYGGCQTTCPFKCGQRLLVLRSHRTAASGHTADASAGDILDGVLCWWEEGVVDANGQLDLPSAPRPASLAPLSCDFWQAPQPFPYECGLPLQLLSSNGWEDWLIDSTGNGCNLFVLRRVGHRSQAQRRKVLLTPFNHTVNGRWPECSYQHLYARDQMLRGMRDGRWQRALSLGEASDGCKVRMAWGDTWADRSLRDLEAHAPLLNDQLDLELEQAKTAATLQAQGIDGRGLLPPPLGGMPLEPMALAFDLRPTRSAVRVPNGTRDVGGGAIGIRPPGSVRRVGTSSSYVNKAHEANTLDALMSRLLLPAQAPSEKAPPARAALVLGEVGSGKTLLCRALMSRALRSGGGTHLLPVYVRVAEVVEMVQRGLLLHGDGGGLLLQWLRRSHGSHSRQFVLLKQALLEGRLLVILDGLDMPPSRATEASGPSGSSSPGFSSAKPSSTADIMSRWAVSLLYHEAAGVLARHCSLLVTARASQVDLRFFPPAMFACFELHPQPIGLLTAASVVLCPSQRKLLRRCVLQSWAAEKQQRPIISALLVAVHARRSGHESSVLGRLQFFVEALNLMLHTSELAATTAQRSHQSRPTQLLPPAPHSPSTLGASLQLRLYVLKRVALHAFGLRQRLVSSTLVAKALDHSAGALVLWRQLQLEAWRGQLPLLTSDRHDASETATLSFCDDSLADVLLALALRDMGVGELSRPAAAQLLTAPSERLKASSSAAPGTCNGQTVQQAAWWAWPEGGYSRLLRRLSGGGCDTLLFVEEHARSEPGWLNIFCNTLSGHALRAHSEPAVDLTKLAVVLTHSTTLRGLQLVDCAIDDAATEVFATALRGMRADCSLECLHLARNNIGPRGAVALARSLPTSVRLLGLEENRLADDGATVLAEMLRANESLATLDLSNNLIGDTGVLRLLDGLASNSTIKQLCLRGNPCKNPAQHGPALEPRFALLEGDAAPVKARVVFT